MRILVIKQASDLQTLSNKLNTGGKSTGKATLEHIKSLNPHVDFQRIEAGTVLLLPDAPELKDSDSQPIAGDAFADLANQMEKGFNTIIQRVRSGAEALVAERAAVVAILSASGVRRHKGDQLLAMQLEDAGKEFTVAQKKALEAENLVEAMQAAVKEELVALRGVLW